MKNFFLTTIIAVCLLIAATVAAHPHFDKSIVAKLPSGAEVTITYNTTPANESHASSAPVNVFVSPRNPQLRVSAALRAGNVSVPQGTYTIGVVKNSDSSWSMALFPGTPGGTVDMTQVIKLDSMFESSAGEAEHMLIDVTPGRGRLEGKAVLTLHFGSLFLAGALS